MEMAQLASMAKGGYYPAPESEAALICRRLRIEPNTQLLNITDTCCGKGEALLQFQNHFRDLGAEQVRSYGNELEKGRYEEASKKLDHVVHGAYEALRTQAHFSFLWGNPPYDDGGLERMETSFLRLHTLKNEKQILQRNAVLALCIPQHVLEDVAPIVANRIDDVSVYRFTDDHYDTFKQVVLFGVFKEPKRSKIKEVRNWLKDIADKGPSAVPPLDHPDGKVYVVPASSEKISYFRGAALQPDEIYKDLLLSPLFQEMADKMFPSTLQKATLKKPILPLKPAHIATAIAAGAVDGHMGSFVIEAYTKRISTKEEIRDADGNLVSEEYTTKPTSVTRIFHPEYGIKDLT